MTFKGGGKRAVSQFETISCFMKLIHVFQIIFLPQTDLQPFQGVAEKQPLSNLTHLQVHLSILSSGKKAHMKSIRCEFLTCRSS